MPSPALWLLKPVGDALPLPPADRHLHAGEQIVQAAVGIVGGSVCGGAVVLLPVLVEAVHRLVA